MNCFAQCSFTYSDGTNFLLSKEFTSVSDAVSWTVSYMDLFSEFIPTFDICPISDDLEASK